jgi:hypothetical protein
MKIKRHLHKPLKFSAGYKADEESKPEDLPAET